MMNTNNSFTSSTSSGSILGTSSTSSPLPPPGTALSTSSVSSTSTSTTTPIRLWNSHAERDQHESYASLFAIIKATEAIEKAYMRDSIPKAEYKEECAKLIGQYLRAVKLAEVTDVKSWMVQQRLQCPVAYHRLVESGVPDTGEIVNSSKMVAEIVQLFVTIKDAIQLDFVSVDTLQPHVEDVCEKLTHFLPPNSEIKAKVQKWLATLNAMRASDKLDAEQSRQMLFDFSSAHDAFFKSI